MTYNNLLEHFNSLIIRDKDRKFSGKMGLERVGELLKRMGKPQNTYPTIHIAGTSGKGSTAFILSSLLNESGFKTGLLLSPHIKDIKERISIDGKLIDEEDFVKTYEELKPFIEEVGEVSYFELLTIIAFSYFSNQHINCAVIETGLGGLLDATNVIDRQDKISVITKIGYDHTHILGNSLEEIAIQKAGIIIPSGEVFVIEQNDEVLKIIREEAEKTNAYLNIVKHPDLINPMENIGRFPGWGEIKVGMYGEHQLENTALCLRVFDSIIEGKKLVVDKDKIKNRIEGLKFPGRFEVKNIDGHIIVIDGAHNPQKIGALVKAVNNRYPSLKKHFILSYKANKDVISCLKSIVLSASKIYLTSFEDNAELTKPPAYPPQEMAKDLEDIDFHSYEIVEDVNKAIKIALERKEAEVIIVTGSMYLIGNIAL